MRICFDMDGTLADLYGVENWLDHLRNFNTLPYEIAKPMLRLNILARYLNKALAMGHEVCVVSWLSKESNTAYDMAVTQAKIEWLEKHLHSVKFTEINITAYDIPKSNYKMSDNDILFDDNITVREEWGEGAYSEKEILKILKEICKKA